MKFLAFSSTSIAALLVAGAAFAAPPLLEPGEWPPALTSNESYIQQIGDFHDAVANQLGASQATSLILQGREGSNDDGNDANVDQQNSTGAASYVVQYDDRNDATVVQRGTNTLSGIVQMGDRNRANVTQTGNAASNPAAFAPTVLQPNGGLQTAAANAIDMIDTTVNDPEGTYTALHAFNGAALVLQVGYRNEADVTQTGDEGTAVVESNGNWNDATITQSALHDDGFILQDGNGNDASITQSAYAGVSVIYQKGNLNDAATNQSSPYAFSVLHQLGNFNNATVTQ